MMSWDDLMLAADVAAGYLTGRVVWLAVSELAIKPLLLHWWTAYRALMDRLPNIK